MGGSAGQVFVSYRRSTSWPLARLVFSDLRSHGFDTFMDLEGLGSGDFGPVILKEIAAREHFVVVLQPLALNRVVESGDWLRRELAHALAMRRNIIPVLADGFRFENERTLPSDIAAVRGLNAVTVPTDYFDAAMSKLRSFLTVRTPVVVAPPRPRDGGDRRVPGRPSAVLPSPRPSGVPPPPPASGRRGRVRRAPATGRLSAEASRVSGAPSGARLLGTVPLPRAPRAPATGRLGREPSRVPGAPAGARLLGMVPLPPRRSTERRDPASSLRDDVAGRRSPPVSAG